MEKIVFDINASNKLDSMIEILFYKGYFSFIENAENYVNKIYDFISTIASQPHKRTKNSQNGLYYCRYKVNAQTSYYIVFNIIDGVYFIKNIISNHTKEYAIYL